MQERRVEEAATAHGLTEIRVLESREAIRLLEKRQVRLRAELRRHLLTLYGFGRQGYLRPLLSIDAERDIPAAIRQIRFLARRDAMALEDFEALGHKLAAEREVLLRQRGLLTSWLEQEQLRRRELTTTRERHRRLLEEVERRQRTLQLRSEQLIEREGRLAKLIELLLGVDELAFSGSRIQDFRGVLDWPVAGEVVTEFGPLLDSLYKTRIPHNGVTIEPYVEPSAVRPIYGGRVLFAAPFEGYGLTVVLSHPGGVLSLYAGLEELQVAKGDVVSLRTLLGTASAGFYFEIREKNRALDPRGWLR